MILAAEILIITVLIIGLIVVLKEDLKLKKIRIPRGDVKEYWNGKERRRSVRIGTAFTIRYNVAKKRPVNLNAQMKNLSSGGMCIITNEKLQEGMVLSLEFDIPGVKKAIGAEGKVVWGDGKFDERDNAGKRIFQTGIQFLTIADDDKEMLANYIEKVAK